MTMHILAQEPTTPLTKSIYFWKVLGRDLGRCLGVLFVRGYLKGDYVFLVFWREPKTVTDLSKETLNFYHNASKTELFRGCFVRYFGGCLEGVGGQGGEKGHGKECSFLSFRGPPTLDFDGALESAARAARPRWGARVGRSSPLDCLTVSLVCTIRSNLSLFDDHAVALARYAHTTW